MTSRGRHRWGVRALNGIYLVALLHATVTARRRRRRHRRTARPLKLVYIYEIKTFQKIIARISQGCARLFNPLCTLLTGCDSFQIKFQRIVRFLYINVWMCWRAIRLFFSVGIF